jgi:hypothetical protein
VPRSFKGTLSPVVCREALAHIKNTKDQSGKDNRCMKGAQYEGGWEGGKEEGENTPNKTEYTVFWII